MTAGILRGIEDGWFMAEIAEAAFPYQAALEKGDKKIVGVNVHTDTVTDDLEILRVSPRGRASSRSGRWPSAARRRDDAAVRAALDADGRGRPRPTAT